MPYQKLHESADLAKTMRDSPVLLYFTASRCGPCQELKPTLTEIGRKDVATVVEIDVDEHGDLAEEYGVRGIPLLRFVTEGGTRVTWESTGVVSKDVIVRHVA